MGRTLLDKVWDAHAVRTLPSGQTQLFIGLHLVHEVTSPQAFAMLRERGLSVRHPELTVATADHIVPTKDQARPFADGTAEVMMAELERNLSGGAITFFGLDSGRQGIVHVIGPELGLTQPGMTICCGDSHTSTHGAFGSIAFGIGTTQVRDVLATQTLAVTKPKVRRITLNGRLQSGVYGKDAILFLISRLGVNGGIGYAYEYAGSAVEAMGMEERMSLCNMSIEGGARCGYVSPDGKTVDYLRGRPYAPKEGGGFSEAVRYWNSVASDPNAAYDDEVPFDASAIEPMVTWGTNPGQAIGISERVPDPAALAGHRRDEAQRALAHMGFEPGAPVEGTPIDVAFIGSCTNGRISDLREAARVAAGRKVHPSVKALVVPGSQAVAAQAVAEGVAQALIDARFEWRKAGCSLCLGMNPDKLVGREMCASSSNRNFIGRQGSQGGRTLLMSPAMVAAAAVEGKVVDVRDYAR